VGGSGPVTVNLNFSVNPGTGYRLELQAGSTPCYYNSFGAAYPYVVAGSPVTITGFVNPGYSTGNFYYFFYNWVVTEGCKSNRVPVSGVVLPLPPVPTISPLWNTLTSSAPSGNQWYLNGSILPGATGQVHVATQAGTYTVVVTDANGCSATSLPTFTTSIQEMLQSSGFVLYPNPVEDMFAVELKETVRKEGWIRVYDVAGKLVMSQTFTGNKTEILFNKEVGTYYVEVFADDKLYRTRFLKQ
jgi:hypothetical protein